MFFFKGAKGDDGGDGLDGEHVSLNEFKETTLLSV